MLIIYLLQFRFENLIIFLLEFLILYNLYQLINQIHLVYLLGYKFIILFYIGITLIYVDLDIFALIMWMIYGSFLVVCFIMSFNWVEATYYLFLERGNYYWITLLVILVLFIIIGVQIELVNETREISIWCLNLTSCYEISIIDFEEELEVLGWGLGFDNFFVLLLMSFILTMVCIYMIYLICAAKKSKLKNYMIFYYSFFQQRNINKFMYLRVQNIYIQNLSKSYNLKRNFKLFHKLRA